MLSVSIARVRFTTVTVALVALVVGSVTGETPFIDFKQRWHVIRIVVQIFILYASDPILGVLASFYLPRNPPSHHTIHPRRRRECGIAGLNTFYAEAGGKSLTCFSTVAVTLASLRQKQPRDNLQQSGLARVSPLFCVYRWLAT